VARKHDWKVRRGRKYIEPVVKHKLIDFQVHTIICKMLNENKTVNITSVHQEIKDILSEHGNSWFKSSNKKLKSHQSTAGFLFKDLFGFRPKLSEGVSNEIINS